jgi:hypothetical protein
MPTLDHTGARWPAEGALPEAVVGVLQDVDVRAGPPDQQLGVGLEAGEVVGPARVDVLLQRGVEELLGVLGERCPVLRQRRLAVKTAYIV